MAQSMGMGFGLESPRTVWKQKHRWLFRIPEISAQGVSALPPLRAARPNVSFREMEVQHLTETISFPGRPEWKTFSLVLYDVRCSHNPVWDWMTQFYDPESGKYGFVVDSKLKKQARLEMFSACGDVIETFKFDNVYPLQIDLGELDMASADIMTIDVTLRYDRAYKV